MELINAFAEARFNEWKANATDEQKAVANANIEKLRTDDEYKGQHMAKMVKAWNDADAN